VTYERLFTSLLLPAYDRARGRRYVERRTFLDGSQWWSRERVLEFQWSALKALLAHAFTSVPYLARKYRAAGIGLEDVRGWNDLRLLPPLTRAEVNAHRAELCSTAYTGRLLPHATGGSTGTPTRFFRTYESYDWRTAAKDRAYSWTGWRAGQRALYLWGAPLGGVTRRRRWKTRLHEAVQRQLIVNTFSQDDRLWDDVYARARRFRPVSIVGYVSSLEAFAAFLHRTGRTLPSLRSAIAAAEPLFEATRRRIEAGLGVPVFNTYGSREFMSIAAECECRDGLHIHAENLLVEAREGADAGTSEILVTDLHNYGMPFVRYAIGDVGVVTNESCPCGRGLPMLRGLEGRVLDSLRTADGRTVPGEFFPHLLKEVPELAHYRVEQQAVDRLVISAVLTAPLSEPSAALLRREVGRVFGAYTTCEVRPVTRIPSLPSGKRRVIVGLGG
jgi:phenylacetate-CoA ligase